MFPLQRVINRGNLRSTGVSRLIAIPLRITDSHPSHRRLLALLLLRWPTIPGYYPLDLGCFARDLWAVPMLAWLLRCRCLTRYCLRPREDGILLVFIALSMLPAPNTKGSATSKISRFSGLRGRFRAFTLYLDRLAYLLDLRLYTCGRLTIPYPRGLLFSLTTSNQSQVRTVPFVVD